MSGAVADETVLDRAAALGGADVPRPGGGDAGQRGVPLARGDGWESLTWRETGERVSAIAAGLLALGIEPEERVAIVSSPGSSGSSPTSASCAPAPRPPRSTRRPPGGRRLHPGRLRHPGRRSPRTPSSSPSCASQRAELPDLATRRARSTARRTATGCSPSTSSKPGTELLDDRPAAVTDRVAAIARRAPRDAHLHLGHHRQAQGRRLIARLLGLRGRRRSTRIGMLTRRRRAVPLAAAGALVRQGAAGGAARASASRPRSTAGSTRSSRTSPSCQPTFMAAVPRIFEKVYNRVVARREDEGGPKCKIFKLGDRRRPRGVDAPPGRPGSPARSCCAKHAVADKLVFSKLRARFGGRLRFFVSGCAPLSPEIAEFFHAAGILILEGYGLTETSAGTLRQPAGASTASAPSGLPLPGTEVQIADDGEILLRGPGVMQRLPQPARGDRRGARRRRLAPHRRHRRARRRRLPADHRPQEGPDQDLGRQVRRAAGDRGQFKAVCPLVSQVLVHGDDRNFCTALVTLDEDALTAWAAHRSVAGELRRALASTRTSTPRSPARSTA